MQIINSNRGTFIAKKVRVAGTFWQRLVGLIGSASLEPGHGVFLTPCQGVHSFGMKYPIDVVYLDQNGMVLQTITLPAWRIGPWLGKARSVLELPAGTCRKQNCCPGDCLAFVDHTER